MTTFTDEFKRIISSSGVHDEFASWLLKEGVTESSHFALLAPTEAKVDEEIIDIALKQGIEFTGIMAKVRVRKLWLLSRQVLEKENLVKSGRIQEEDDSALPAEVATELQTCWDRRHNFRLSPSRLVVDNFLHRLFKEVNAKKFSLYMLESIRTLVSTEKKSFINIVRSGRNLGADEIIADDISSYHELWLRFRALFSSITYVSVGNPNWFSLSDCEQLCDTVLAYLNQRFNKARPPVEFYQNAYIQTMNVWVNEVRTNSKPLKEAVAATSNWSHFWTIYNPSQFQTQKGQGQGRMQQAATSSGVPDLDREVASELKRYKELTSKLQSERDRWMKESRDAGSSSDLPPLHRQRAKGKGKGGGKLGGNQKKAAPLNWCVVNAPRHVQRTLWRKLAVLVGACLGASRNGRFVAVL